MSTKKLLTTALLIIAIVVSAVVYTHKSLVDLEEIITSELVYVNNSSEFENYTYPIQVDNSLPNKLVPYKWNILRSNKPIISLVFNGYPSEQPYQRVYVFELEKKSWFSKSYTLSSRANIRISNIEYNEALSLVENYDVRDKNDSSEKYNISNFEVKQYPSQSTTEEKNQIEENRPTEQIILLSQAIPEIQESLNNSVEIEEPSEREVALLNDRSSFQAILLELENGKTIESRGYQISKGDIKFVYKIEETIGVIDNIYLPEIDSEKYPRDEEWLDKLNEKYGGNPTLEY